MKVHYSRSVSACLGALIAVIMLLGMRNIGSAAPVEELTVPSFGGTLGKFYDTYVNQPFEKETGARLNIVTGLSMQVLAKLRASKGDPQIDIGIFDPPASIPAVNEGLLQKLDAPKIPNLKDIPAWAREPNNYDVGFVAGYDCLTYNTTFVKTPPTSWTDLWKPEYKGKVIIPDISTSHAFLFIAMTSRIATGNSFYDTNAAFAKLETLKPDVLTYWTSHDQVVQLINSGQAWVAAESIDRVITQVQAGAPMNCVIPKENTIFGVAQIGIAKGTKHLALAEKYVNKMLDPQVQFEIATHAFEGPTNGKVQLTGVAAKYLSPQKLGSLLQLDWPKLIQVENAWTDRWNQVMVK